MIDEIFERKGIRYRVIDKLEENYYTYFIIENIRTGLNRKVTSRTIRKYLDEYKNTNKGRWENAII